MNYYCTITLSLPTPKSLLGCELLTRANYSLKLPIRYHKQHPEDIKLLSSTSARVRQHDRLCSTSGTLGSSRQLPNKHVEGDLTPQLGTLPVLPISLFVYYPDETGKIF